jgi:hypothetical protein
MMIYEQASNAGIPISGAGTRRHLPHSTPPGSAYSPYTIANLTCERPNVYYEIGFAHGLQRSPILFRKTGAQLHFDLSVRKAPAYKNQTELAQMLRRRLSAIVGQSP